MELSDLNKVIMREPPAFHFWDGRPQTGGFDNTDFEDFANVVDSYCEINAKSRSDLLFIETGAGLSTLWFLGSGLRVISFSLPGVLNKIQAFFDENSVDVRSRWKSIAGESERNLAKTVESLEGEQCDISLIDGNHAVPSVFHDFVGLNICLKPGGLLLVDDLQLPGPALLKQLLDQSPETWSHFLTSKKKKWTCYRKISDTPIMIGNMADFKFAKGV